ncbi:MAG TPA: hypothetical protein VMZ25_03065 [Terriglobales bacterium]|nr:hypothetical protein [Terriglobales bacterium]
MTHDDFMIKYGQMKDDEVLALASARSSLTEEAGSALDSELRRRNLTESDQVNYERFVNNANRRESRKLRRKIFGRRVTNDSWVDDLTFIYWSALAMTLIAFAYLALPARYQFVPDWRDAATNMMFVSVPIAVGGFSYWRKLSFWIVLLVSSTLHLLLVHAWIIKVGAFTVGRGGSERWAWFLGVVLFFLVLGISGMFRQRPGNVNDEG